MLLVPLHHASFWYLFILIILNQFIWIINGCTSSIQYFSTPNELFTNGLLNAKPGDCLILLDGIYEYNAAINIKTSDISIKAETLGGVIFIPSTTGISFKFESSASNVLFEGFQFVNGYSVDLLNIIDVSGSNNTFSELNFYNMTATKYINIKAPTQFNTIIHCNFEYKPAEAPSGNLIEINADGKVIGYHVIRYCSFSNMAGLGGDYGNEPIRIGESTESTFISRTIVEFCVFNNTGLGDSESVSIKSNENLVRYSTFTSNQGAMLSFRNCNYNVAYGNFFLGAGGCRIKQANNVFIYNNYFENSGYAREHTYPIEFRNLSDVSEPYYLYRINVTLQFNTFVNSEYIELDTVQKFNNSWSNNIFYKSDDNLGYLFDGSTIGSSFLSNIYFGILTDSNNNASFASVSRSELVYSDPLLVRNSYDYFQPDMDSPATHSANSNSSNFPIFDIPVLDDDPNIMLDISGRIRSADGNKDIGCSQNDAYGTVSNIPRSIYNTGTSYKLTFNHRD